MDLLSSVITYSRTANYFLLFIVYLIEGPVANFVSAMIAEQGMLNIWIVFILAALAEVIADIFFFYIGKKLTNTWIDRTLKAFEENFLFEEIRQFIKESSFWGIFIIKMIPIIAVPGIIYIGQDNMKWKTFIKYGVPISIFRNILISYLGYNIMLSLDSFFRIYSAYRMVISLLTVMLFVLLLLLLRSEKVGKYLLEVVKKVSNINSKNK